ncbi:MAG: pyrroline-5-carboxylate reductase [Candidatus Saganbacteria bacterium]|nr:pyrroline-5-carboxylate reductase [Candidatus Saganbacteria bacterium]
MTNIGFIGGGKMAEAIIKGLLDSGCVAAADVHVAEIRRERRQQLAAACRVGVYADNSEVAGLHPDVLVLAVKPQDLANAVNGLVVHGRSLVISIAAGLTLATLEKAFPQNAVIRAMPNNPALVKAGVTALAPGRKVKPDQLELAKKIFGSVGGVVTVDEKLMDAVTGLSGSGPAYVYLMIEGLTRAGVKLGLENKTAEHLAVETVFGAAKTLKESGRGARELREMVTSPGGTTIEGLKVLEKKGFIPALLDAVKAAAEKSKKLSQ